VSALSLDHVRLIPTGDPWHRTRPIASAAQRLHMARLACAGNAQFVVDDREVISNAPGYTVDTLSSLRAELGVTQPLCLLLGADAFLGVTGWHQWEALFDLAHIAVVQRPGFALEVAHMAPALQGQWTARRETAAHALASSAAGRILSFDITPLAISASRIRAELGARVSPRYLLPQPVLDYIEENHLYQA
jgi:nicotinate-nucleotide adenylyltransferase